MSASNVECAIPARDSGAVILHLPSQRLTSTGKSSRVETSLQPANVTNETLEAGTSTTNPETAAQPKCKDRLPATNGMCITYTQEDNFTHRDDAKSAEDSTVSTGSQNPMRSAMRGQVEALQMEVARLTSTIREVMEMDGRRGPPPAYKKSVDSLPRASSCID